MLSCDVVASLAMSREGHLDQYLKVFGYLKKHDRSKMFFDKMELNIDPSRFTKCERAEFYPYAKEAIPPNAPEA